MRTTTETKEKMVETPRIRAMIGGQISPDEEMFGRAFNGHVLKRLFSYVWPYRRMCVMALIAILVFVGTQLSIPLAILYTIDYSLKPISGTSIPLSVAIAILAVVVTVNYVASYFQELMVGRINENVVVDLRSAMFSHLQKISLSFLDKTEVGRVMSRLQGDTAALQQFLQTSASALGDLVLLLGIVVMLLVLNFELGMLSLSIVPILFIGRIVWLPYARVAFLKARETNSMANGALAETIHGVRAVKTAVREDVNYRLYLKLCDLNWRSHLKASKIVQVNVPVVDTLTGIALAIVVVVGGRMVIGGNLEIGVMVAFIFYVQRFFDPIRSLTMQYSTMQRAMVSGQRIFEVLDVPEAVQDVPNAFELDQCEGAIAFRNVNFSYTPEETVLKDFSFSVMPREKIAIVGPTGSGKSTVGALLRRFYDPNSGQVLIDGHDVRTLTQESMGKHIAMVLQDPFLFSGTIFENIRYASVAKSRAEIENAANVVGAHEFISHLPGGYDFTLDQGGKNLSLGQRQLLSIARALVLDARIVILDEATANVDSYSERKVQKALEIVLMGRTAIVIAHRLSTVRDCDRILVLQHGRIVEEGSHDYLIKLDGLYARLCQMNDASFDDLE